LDDAAVTHAIAAADRAERLGAHREAAAHFGHALARSTRLTRAVEADLLERCSVACAVSDQMVEAVAAAEGVVGLRSELADPLGTGDALRWLSRVHYMSDSPGRSEE